ncbi:hypothetical protein PIB30_040287 [Stylosanthes scabra]|uniref:Uncharacterized protein n=1 Tax=Stylosanthes scabra TaxID=79078 RepID=A0ABU6YFA2_9FABA|nr:hypothetical protein [Stylosanthes scabra]
MKIFINLKFLTGLRECVKGSHDKKSGSKRKKEGENPIAMVSEPDVGEQLSILVVEIGPLIFDEEEDIMYILKEMNETRALKRRKAKKKEKAHKSRPENTILTIWSNPIRNTSGRPKLTQSNQLCMENLEQVSPNQAQPAKKEK